MVGSKKKKSDEETSSKFTVTEKVNPDKQDSRYSISNHTQKQYNLEVLLEGLSDRYHKYESVESGRTITIKTDFLPDEEEFEAVLNHIEILEGMLADSVIVMLERDKEKIRARIVEEDEKLETELQEEGEEEEEAPDPPPKKKASTKKQTRKKDDEFDVDKLNKEPGTITEGQEKTINLLLKHVEENQEIVSDFIENVDDEQITAPVDLSIHHASLLIDAMKKPSWWKKK